MSKDVRETPKKEEASCTDRELTEGRESLASLVEDLRGDLRGFVVEAGYRVFLELLEEERELVCGRRYAHNEGRDAYRHGYDKGSLVFGGRKISVPKPRVRSIDGKEIELETWRQASSKDPIEDRVMAQIIAGVSTRKYRQSLEAAPAEAEALCDSKSSVSRMFVARTKEQVRKFLSLPLGELDLPVIMVDGTGLGDHLMLVALGIEADGSKHVLGVAEGTTESSQVCVALFRNLIDRGLVVERPRLFVTDGGRGIQCAIRKTFGNWGLVQRCHVHKLKNILDHLPRHKRPWVRHQVQRAWDENTAKQAKQRLLRLAKKLEEPHPGAAGSVLEGLDEALTLHRIGIRGALYRTLRSTNPVENLQGSIKNFTRHVKRWRSGSMALRWCVTALSEAQLHFRRIKGCTAMPYLMAALDTAMEHNNQFDTRSDVA
jgi:transposase-like protein